MTDKYIKTEWLDFEVERPRTYNLIKNDDDSTTLIEAFGQVTQEGTPVNRANMMKIENELERLSEMDFTTSQPFTINEASKDESGNPNFVSVSGDQINFNGAVSYTQANGESKEYASVSPIAVFKNWVQPDVTGENPSYGVVTSSSAYPNRYDWKCLQLTPNRETESDDWSTNNSVLGWWKFKFNSLKKLKQIKFTNRWWISNNPTDLACVGSFYADEDKTIKLGDIDVNSSLQEVIIDIPDVITDTIYFDKTGGGSYSGIGRLEFSADEFVEGYVMLDNGVASVVPAVNIQELEPENNAVWYNPKTSVAKQYNGTGWVDYNGVPVAQIIDDVVYNYQYNTWLDLDTRVGTYTQKTKDEIINWGMPDYTKRINISFPFTAPSDGLIIAGLQTTDGFMTLYVDGIDVTGSQGGQWLTHNSVSFMVGKGQVVTSNRGLSFSNFQPLKGVED